MRTDRIALVALALALATPLWSQERSGSREGRLVDTVVVTASRREERLGSTVVATEVIGAREIARAPVADLGALLARFAGIQLDAGVPAGHGVALQGLGGPRVLILLDGQPVAGRVNGTLDLARIPLALIERIEVVKGPQSTLYGSAAMGGVINIVTRRPQARGADVGLTALGGSQGRGELTAHAGRAFGDWAARVDGGATRLGIAPGVGDADGAQSLRAHVAPRLVRRGTDSTWALEVSALVVDEAQRFRVGQLYSFSDNLQTGASLSATRRRGLSRVTPTLSWSRFEHLSRRASTPTPAADSGARDVQDLLQVEVPIAHVLRSGMLDAGLLLRRETIVADRVPGGQRAAHSAEPYAQWSFGIGPAVLTAGARFTGHEEWGTFLAPRVAALWRPTESVAVRLSAGRGFRTPDFKEQFIAFANAPAGYAVVGNPDLRPEHSSSASATVARSGRRGELRVHAHVAAYRDFIESMLVDAGTSTYSFRNLGSGRIAGTELEWLAVVGGARLEASHAFLWSRDDASGRPLLGRAPHTATLGVVAPVLGTEFSARAQWTARTPIAHDASSGALTHRAAFAQLDLGASRRIGPWLTARVGVVNALGARPLGTWPTFAGRQWFAGVAVD